MKFKKIIICKLNNLIKWLRKYNTYISFNKFKIIKMYLNILYFYANLLIVTTKFKFENYIQYKNDHAN